MGMAVNKVFENPYSLQKNENIVKKSDPADGKIRYINQGILEIEDFMKGLKKAYPDAQIHIADLEDAASINDFARKNYGGFHIVISQEALKKMMTDKKFREKCESAFQKAKENHVQKVKDFNQRGKVLLGTGLAVDEEGNAVQWTASLSANQQTTKPQNWGSCTGNGGDSISRYHAKDGVLTIKKRLSYKPARDLQRIARSTNEQSVKRTMSGIHSQIYQLRASRGDKKVIAQLVSQANQVLLKAKLKIKLLNKEELMEVQQKNQRAKAEYKKAARTGQMLEERRQRRQIKEYGQVRNYYPSPYEKEQERREANQERAAEQASADYGSQVYAPSVDITGVTVGTVSAQGAATGISINITI